MSDVKVATGMNELIDYSLYELFGAIDEQRCQNSSINFVVQTYNYIFFVILCNPSSHEFTSVFFSAPAYEFLQYL